LQRHPGAAACSIFGAAWLVAIPATLILWVGMAAYFIAIDRKSLFLGVSLFALLNCLGAQIYFWFIYLPRMRKLHPATSP
jgi:hypothetical protein